MAQQVHDAGLNCGLGEHREDRLRKALQAIDHGQQDILDAAVAQLVHDTQPELGSFVLFKPQTQDFLGAVRTNPERNVHRLVAHQPFVADLRGGSVIRYSVSVPLGGSPAG